jgi:CBS domain-containing protein
MNPYIDRASSVAAMAREFAQIGPLEKLAALRRRAEVEISQLLRDGMPPLPAGTLAGDFNDALTRRLITLAEDRLADEGLFPPSSHLCWMTLGSDGRREQVTRTDQDTALVYEDPPGQEKVHAGQYFRKLAGFVTDGLDACGYARCPGNTMASNPRWCQPLARWYGYFHDWIRVPKPDALLHASIFFDFRPAAGDPALTDELRHSILGELRRDRTCLVLMAGHSTQHPPPLTMFRRPALETSGAHAGKFDIKLRAMKPLVEAARVLAIDAGAIGVTNTIDRFCAAALAEPSSSSLCGDGRSAYEFFLSFRQKYGTADGGRFLDINGIPSAEYNEFRDALLLVNGVMRGMRVRYQLDVLGV